jgi:hypothetical protein
MRLRIVSAAVISIALVLLACLHSGASDTPAQKKENPVSAVSFQYGQPKELCLLKDPRINESSGLAASIRIKDAFWTHNDSGDSARIFLFTKSGETLAMVQIKGVKAIDWEDIASFKHGEEGYILIGDVGDNARRRTDAVLYIVREPSIAPSAATKEALTLEVEPLATIRFSYEDGPRDCEAVAVDSTESTVYLASKQASEIKVYSMPISLKEAKQSGVAKAAAPLTVPYATAMDISPDGMRAVVLTYLDAYEYVRAGVETWAQAFSREPRMIKMPTRRQGESICYGRDGKTLYLTSENGSQPLWEVSAVDDRP